MKTFLVRTVVLFLVSPPHFRDCTVPIAERLGSADDDAPRTDCGFVSCIAVSAFTNFTVTTERLGSADEDAPRTDCGFASCIAASAFTDCKVPIAERLGSAFEDAPRTDGGVFACITTPGFTLCVVPTVERLGMSADEEFTGFVAVADFPFCTVPTAVNGDCAGCKPVVVRIVPAAFPALFWSATGLAVDLIAGPRWWC
ncbi:hypothetical protein PF008_g26323 [Phytophthora fragariae]|uniref:Uncharacterized protein n=1 Tax=Phytophthora fragariae TaxID=53985 RepID=A0A6G0QHD8_9STRA|nr:hypothetical protein PF008_g26323 [Phytophthora fragariae]